MTESIATETGIKILKHKHHIIPKHMGGSDDASNLIELTPEEHAEAHKNLYELYGNLYDKIAWLSLSGRVTKEEAARMAASEAMKKRTRTREEFTKGWETRRRSNWVPSDESKQKQSKALKGKKKPEFSNEHKENLSKSIKEKYDKGELKSGYPNHIGSKWWNNGTINKRSKEKPSDEWIAGRLNFIDKSINI